MGVHINELNYNLKAATLPSLLCYYMELMEANKNPGDPQPENPKRSEKLSLDHALLSYELAPNKFLYRCGRCYWRVPDDHLAGEQPVCPQEHCGAKWQYLGYFLDSLLGDGLSQDAPYDLTVYNGYIIKAESVRGTIRRDIFYAPACRGDTMPGWTQKIQDVPLSDQQPYL